jgi:hypothetical protein
MYFVVLNWASLQGLSLETFGHECDRGTRRSISSWETFLSAAAA